MFIFHSVWASKASSLYLSNNHYALVLQGRKEDPAQQEVELTTAPSVDNGTHWGQQVMSPNFSSIFLIIEIR